MSTTVTLGKFLKAKRKDKGHRQVDAAKEMAVSEVTVRSWERGQKPVLAHIFRVADYCGCTVDDLRPYILEEA